MGKTLINCQNIKECNYIPYYTVSLDGQIIVYQFGYRLYMQNISRIPIKGIIDVNYGAYPIKRISNIYVNF